jgi:hypothetical protein
VTLVWLVALTLVLAPGAAEACATCISSAYGDRTYNLAYLGLLLAPFVLAIAIGGILTRCYVASRREAAAPTDPMPDEDPEPRPGVPGACASAGGMGGVGSPPIPEETTWTTR